MVNALLFSFVFPSQALKENPSSGYLVGDELSIADIYFIDVLTWVWEYDEELVKEFPAVTVTISFSIYFHKNYMLARFFIDFMMLIDQGTISLTYTTRRKMGIL